MRIFFLLFAFLFTSSCKVKDEVKTPIPPKPNLFQKEIYLQRAHSYIGSQSYLQAEKELKKAISIDPRDYKPYLMLGSIYDKMGEDKKAISAYIIGIRLKKGIKDEKMGTYSLRNPFQPMQRKPNNPLQTKP